MTVDSDKWLAQGENLRFTGSSWAGKECSTLWKIVEAGVYKGEKSNNLSLQHKYSTGLLYENIPRMTPKISNPKDHGNATAHTIYGQVAARAYDKVAKGLRSVVNSYHMSESEKQNLSENIEERLRIIRGVYGLH